MGMAEAWARGVAQQETQTSPVAREQESFTQELPAFFVEDDVRGHEGPEGREMHRMLEACKANDAQEGFVAVGNRDTAEESLGAVAGVVQSLRSFLRDGVVPSIENWKQAGFDDARMRHEAEQMIKAHIEKVNTGLRSKDVTEQAKGISFAFGQIIEGIDGVQRLLQATVGDADAYLQRGDQLYRLGAHGKDIGEQTRFAEQRMGSGPVQADVLSYALEPGDRVVMTTGVSDMLNLDQVRQVVQEGRRPQEIEQLLQERAARIARDDFDERASNVFSAVVMDVPRVAEHVEEVASIPEVGEPPVLKKQERAPQPSRRAEFLKRRQQEITTEIRQLTNRVEALTREGRSKKEIVAAEQKLWEAKADLAEKDLWVARLQQETVEQSLPPFFQAGEGGIAEVDANGVETHNTLMIRGYDAGSREYIVQRFGPTRVAMGAEQRMDRFTFDLGFVETTEEEEQLRFAINAERAITRAQKHAMIAEQNLARVNQEMERVTYAEEQRVEPSGEEESALYEQRTQVQERLHRFEGALALIRTKGRQLAELGDPRYLSPSQRENMTLLQQERREALLELGTEVGSLNALREQIDQMRTVVQGIDQQLAS
jgi:serine/threonine protein phosphatase PrpC